MGQKFGISRPAVTLGFIYVLGLIVTSHAPETKGRPYPE
jgi:hypothetical protein